MVVQAKGLWIACSTGDDLSLEIARQLAEVCCVIAVEQLLIESCVTNLLRGEIGADVGNIASDQGFLPSYGFKKNQPKALLHRGAEQVASPSHPIDKRQLVIFHNAKAEWQAQLLGKVFPKIVTLAPTWICLLYTSPSPRDRG